MSILSHLPPIVLAQASATLRALAQAAGQTLEARVLSQPDNGMTQVQIGRQVMTLALPTSQPVGTTLTLSAQQSDGQLRLSIVSVSPPAGSNGLAPLAGATLAPATSVQLSAAALSGVAPRAETAKPPPATVHPGSMVRPTPPMAGAASPTPDSAGIAAPGRAATYVPTGQTAAGVSASPGQSAVAPGPTALPATPAVSQGVSPISTVTGPATAQQGVAPAVPLGGGGGAVLNGGPAISGLPVLTDPGQVTPGTLNAAGPPRAASPPAPGGVPGQQPASRADIPYPVAAPTPAASSATALTGSAVAALPPVSQSLPSSTVGQHAPSPNMPAPRSEQVRPEGLRPQVPVSTSSQQTTLAQMVQQSLPSQGSIVALTTALAAMAGKVTFPEPVAKAASTLLASRLSFDGTPPGGAAIREAIQKSGIFQEALLAAGRGASAAGDTKTALLTLRQSLGSWLGNHAPVAPVSGLAPPLRGQIPRARAGDGVLPDFPQDPVEAGKVLLERTEAALSRMRLHQNASLPEPHAVRHDTQWSLDLPVVVGGQQHLLHMQIHGEPESEDDKSEDRGWQVRFAINLGQRGEVGAQITLRGRTTGVLLWADDGETAQSLAAAADDLREAIAAVGLTAGPIVVRTGAPVPQPTRAPERAGHHVDATR